MGARRRRARAAPPAARARWPARPPPRTCAGGGRPPGARPPRSFALQAAAASCVAPSTSRRTTLGVADAAASWRAPTCCTLAARTAAAFPTHTRLSFLITTEQAASAAGEEAAEPAWAWRARREMLWSGGCSLVAGCSAPPSPKRAVTAAATGDELATVVLPRSAPPSPCRWAGSAPTSHARRNSATAAVHLASRRHRRVRVALAVLRERSFAAAAVDAAGAYAAARCVTRRRVVGTQRAMMQWRREAALARAVAVVSSNADFRRRRRAFLRLRSAVYAAAELRFISALGAQAAAQRAVRGEFTRWACTAWAERRLPRLQRSRWLLRHTLHAWWGAALRELKRGSALIAVAVGWNVAAAMLRGLTRLRRHRVARRARKIANAQQRIYSHAAAAEAFAAFGLARRRRGARRPREARGGAAVPAPVEAAESVAGGATSRASTPRSSSRPSGGRGPG